jgi:transcription antitermination factor NusG
VLSLSQCVAEVGVACLVFPADGVAVPTSYWYALRVRTRSELLAAEALRSKGYATFCPTYPERRRYSDRIKTVESVAFPGYVFCRFEALNKAAILSTQGIDSIVSIAGRMASIPDWEIEQVRLAIAHGAQPAEYKVGQPVRIEYGAFAGIEGLLLGVERDHLLVSIQLLQRSVSLQINQEQVTALQRN